MELPVSKEILGRIFSGAGRPIDGLGEVYAEAEMDINGLPLNLYHGYIHVTILILEFLQLTV